MLVLLGVLVLINPLRINETGPLIGIVVALLGGILLSAWVVYGRVAGKKKHEPEVMQFYYSAFLVAFLVIIFPLLLLITKDPAMISFSFNLPLKLWFFIGVFALVSTIIPHLLYFRGMQKVKASDAGIILLLEPVSAAALAALFLKQSITLNLLLGGALILLANYLVIINNKKTKK